MAITGTQGPSGIGNIDLSQVDLETALMAVQSERANLLESQLKDQLSAVQNRNQQIQVLNDALANVRQARPSSPNGTGQITGDVNVPDALNGGSSSTSSTSSTASVLQSFGIAYNTDAKGNLNQSQFDQLISTITSHIDGLNSSQQMDMLRMQSLTNKRNEAFDTMTGFLKKSDDSRKNIVDHM